MGFPYSILKNSWHLFKIFYLFIHDRQREREAEAQTEGEAGSMPGARCGTRSWDSRIAPWAKGRHETAEPPKDPLGFRLYGFLKGGNYRSRKQEGVGLTMEVMGTWER